MIILDETGTHLNKAKSRVLFKHNIIPWKIDFCEYH